MVFHTDISFKFSHTYTYIYTRTISTMKLYTDCMWGGGGSIGKLSTSDRSMGKLANCFKGLHNTFPACTKYLTKDSGKHVIYGGKGLRLYYD